MQWPQLLCADRLGTDKKVAPDPARSPYPVDADRITFCSAFRRLQDKTQVFPLADNDYVRTRLTHSLEVASVARSLGARVGAEIVKRRGLAPQFHASDFGAITAAAALAHDLGNPPFGHSGEDAMAHWFKTSPFAKRARAELSRTERADLGSFEGNAQGFRVIARLQMPDNPGLQLTCATLGAFTKYPCASTTPESARRGVSTKKFGFFHADRDLFAEVAARTGLLRRSKTGVWCRHPLAFLVEAADDICYRLVDFEDGFRLKHLDYETVRDAFVEVSGDPKDRERAARMRDPKDGIAFLRAKAIGSAIYQASEVFLAHEAELLDGKFDRELLDLIPAAAALGGIKEQSKKTIYSTQRGVEIEAAGYEVLGGLLDVFFGAVDELARCGKKVSRRSQKLVSLIPTQFLESDRTASRSTYQRLLRITDFVSGMTDSYAVSLYKKVRGISLPGQ